ncbi:MAG: ammonium transporter [Bacteroidota bacterium]
MSRTFKTIFVTALLLFGTLGAAFAQDTGVNNISSILDVQKYERAIHIMAMLLLGFGFLMVFVKRYGRSALTATVLVVSVSLPLYYLLSGYNIMGGEKGEIEKLILAEFAAASLLIAAGAVLGRLKMYQYIILALLFIPAYKLNEWIVINDCFHILNHNVADTGGSIVIHAFGALFGIGASLSLTRKNEIDAPVESDATSDRYSMLGSLVLWLFWPSFCAALVPVEAIPHTVINVFFALCGSTLATYLLSVAIRGKISIADIANAALAGGVAIGSTCDKAGHGSAIIIGILAGAISTVGFALVSERQKKLLKAVDTCGVTNLHGMPGIFGGLAAIPIVHGLDAGNQLGGILITVLISIICGVITGKLISFMGKRKEVYVDAEEFVEGD